MICSDTVFHDLKPDAAGYSGENSVDWQVPADLPYLNGHFPGTPILPAIAMIDASMHLINLAMAKTDLRLRTVAQAKFLSPIVPGQQLRIDWKFTAEGSALVEWKERADNRLLASLSLEFGE